MSLLSSEFEPVCERLLKAGNLDAALQTTSHWARQEPADAGLRISLFQLLAANGEWQRAAQQLQLAARLDPAWLPVAEAYRHILSAEREREQVLGGMVYPLMLGPVAAWQTDLLQALQHDRHGQRGQAEQRRRLALDSAEAIPGIIDGEPFHWLCDADTRFGPCLEVILEQGYAWIPFQHLRSLTLPAPADLRDLLWQHIDIVWRDGTAMRGVVPCRYPGSESSEDGAIRLGKRTDWLDGQGSEHGVGQRMLASQERDYPLLEVRSIRFGDSTAEMG